MAIEENITNEEEKLLVSLRANDWGEFQGQETIKKSLQIAIQAAKQRNDAVDHVLFYGPPGLGKTTLSHLIAKQMEANLRMTSGTALAKSGDLAAILTNLEQGDILFIDEIHRLPKTVEEMLYSAMEDFALDIVLGKGPSARTVRLDLPSFTLVGATTKFGSLAGPFRDRFGLVHRLEHYDDSDLNNILQKAAEKLSVVLDTDSGLQIARRSRGTPRISLQLLKRVRDFAQIENGGSITPGSVDQALTLLAVDEVGLTHSDRKYLKSIISKHQGGPIGLSTIAALLHEDPGTVEEVLEPFLMKIGFVKRTPQGRVVTQRGYQHLGLEFPEEKN